MSQGVSAYSKANIAVQLSPRELEAQLLMKGAAKLEAAKRDWSDKAGVADALAYNRKLWSILASSATTPENPLPQKAKDDFGSLAVFFLRSLVALSAAPTPAPDTINRLIDINTTVAAGLRA